MKKLLIALILGMFLFVINGTSYAYDPTSLPNNKVGIHILFPSELSQAATLVNSNGGDFGYVTIPIQSGDKDILKWQKFMDDAKSLHIIPIIRLATEGDYFNTKVWRKPTFADVLDFSNFLDSINWPTKNRYIVVYNEVNRGDEWGGTPNANEYAQILSYAVAVFKSKNPDFFLISAGMDNASANTNDAVNEYDFFAQMNQAIPGIFNQVDGLSSHSYPNPGFSQPATADTRESITSFKYEKAFISQFTAKNLPTFITETGWSKDVLPQSVITKYFQTAFTSVWNDNNVIAVTPFLLSAGGGPFAQFSFLNPDGSGNEIYQAIHNLSKVKGLPTLTPSVLAASVKFTPTVTKDYSDSLLNVSFRHEVKQVITYLFQLP